VGLEWKKETHCGSGLGSWETLVTAPSRDTIPERWGERTHSRTQDQLNLNCSALAAARLQLQTLASGVENFHIGFLSCSRVRGSGRQPAMSVILPGQVFSRTCYCCSWCMYSCLCMVCEGLTLAGVCAGCHRGNSCAPVQPARRPWCTSEDSRRGHSCLRHFC